MDNSSLSSDDVHLLETLAVGDSMDYALWPGLVPRLTSRLKEILLHEFPIPSLPHPQPSSSSPVPAPSSQTASGESQGTANSFTLADKENVTPAPSQQAASASAPRSHLPPASLPPQLASLAETTLETLIAHFSTYPPHTIQRLSELILTPKAHYRNLPAYLYALDRVVNVTSGANVYPLPAAVPSATGAKVLSNGVASADPEAVSWGASTHTVPSFGDDESLGGALLSPIPWLSSAAKTDDDTVPETEPEARTEANTENVNGPDSTSNIESEAHDASANAPGEDEDAPRTTGSVTQGELLRQEQQAGVVPASQLDHAPHPNGDGEEDEIPHARGPDKIGMEDMGPQSSKSALQHGVQDIDVEAAVGRKTENHEDRPGRSTPPPQSSKREADDSIEHENKRLKDDHDASDAVERLSGQEKSDAAPSGTSDKPQDTAE